MSIWILAIVLLAIFGALGFAQGSIRMMISFLGVIFGVFLAVPLGGIVRPLLGTMGIKNPVWLTIIPPVIMFLFIYLVVSGIAFFVHHKIYLTYKYKRDDVDRIRWERMNRSVGAAIGVFTGAVFFFLLCGVIYAGGYMTSKLSAEDNNPGYIKFMNSVRDDMTQTGFDKAAAKFDPAPKLFYQAADVLGLLYHNPLLQGRLSAYPYYLTLAQRPEFQEIATDKEYNDLIFGKAPVNQIIAHPRTQAMLANKEVIDYLKGTDTKDLVEYLHTGKSPKYDPIGILGVWNLDKGAIVTQMRKANPDIKARELRLLKEKFEAIPQITLIATPDQKIIYNSAAPAEPAAAAPAEAAPAAPDPMDRYRRAGLVPAPAAAPAPAAPAPAEAGPAIPQLSGEGKWIESAGQYVLTATDAAGKEQSITAELRGGEELILHTPIIALVFSKQ